MFKLTIASLLIITLVPSQSISNDEFTLDEFLDGKAVTAYEMFQNQIDRVKEVIKSSYVGIDTDRLRDHVENYVELEKKRLASDVNVYVDYIKTSRRRIFEIWSSYMPTTDPASRMENPESKLSVPAIIVRNGYDCETHTIVSQGYVLNVHRIPRPKNGSRIARETVILHHGLFSSSFDWVINGPEKSLGYVLADAGYDVWMANARGSIDAREHTSYKTDTKEFWNFSFHELGEHDVPALIDYILKVKGEDTKIAYVGYSMGTTVLFTMLSLRPEYNDKLSFGLAMAPTAYVKHIKFPLKNFVSGLGYTALWYRSYEVLHRFFFQNLYLNCENTNVLLSAACQSILFQIVGEDKEQLNQTIFLNYLARGNSASWKTVIHFMQMIDSGEFKQFDYGNVEFNRIVYGEPTPPEYYLGKVRLNLTLLWAENDALSSEKDVLKLYEKLPRTTTLYKMPYEKFNHVDYLWAKDADTLVTSKVLEALRGAMRSQYFDYDPAV